MGRACTYVHYSRGTKGKTDRKGWPRTNVSCRQAVLHATTTETHAPGNPCVSELAASLSASLPTRTKNLWPPGKRHGGRSFRAFTRHGRAEPPVTYSKSPKPGQLAGHQLAWRAHIDRCGGSPQVPPRKTRISYYHGRPPRLAGLGCMHAWAPGAAPRPAELTGAGINVEVSNRRGPAMVVRLLHGLAGQDTRACCRAAAGERPARSRGSLTCGKGPRATSQAPMSESRGNDKLPCQGYPTRCHAAVGTLAGCPRWPAGWMLALTRTSTAARRLKEGACNWE